MSDERANTTPGCLHLSEVSDPMTADVVMPEHRCEDCGKVLRKVVLRPYDGEIEVL